MWFGIAMFVIAIVISLIANGTPESTVLYYDLVEGAQDARQNKKTEVVVEEQGPPPKARKKQAAAEQPPRRQAGPRGPSPLDDERPLGSREETPADALARDIYENTEM